MLTPSWRFTRNFTFFLQRYSFYHYAQNSCPLRKGTLNRAPRKSTMLKNYAASGGGNGRVQSCLRPVPEEDNLLCTSVCPFPWGWEHKTKRQHLGELLGPVGDETLAATSQRIKFCNPTYPCRCCPRSQREMPLVHPAPFHFPVLQEALPCAALRHIFPFCKLLPVSLSRSQSEEAGHRFAEWEEGSVINGILCCLHKHLKYTDSWKVSSSYAGQTERNTGRYHRKAFNQWGAAPLEKYLSFFEHYCCTELNEEL